MKKLGMYVGLVAVMMNLAQVPQARAWLVVDSFDKFNGTRDMIQFGNNPIVRTFNGTLFALGCIALLPICLLDEKTGASSGVATEADLLANGYSSDEAGRILQGQAEFAAALIEQGLRFHLDRSQSQSDLATEIRKVAPAVSDEYIEFMTQGARSSK